MNAEQKNQIAHMRADGKSYTEISKVAGASVNAIKTYCYRHNLTGTDGQPIQLAPAPDREATCKQCGRPLNPERKTVRFCSNTCKTRWWNAHPDMLHQSKARMHVCRHCGKIFYSYTRRKYCCHPCYISERYER